MADDKIQVKTYIRGSFLYSEDGLDYQEKHRQTEEKIIQYRSGVQSVQKEFRDKKNAQIQKKKMSKTGNKIVQKPVLIPIRDTPVEPVPQPVLENQKCQRATQQQFQYFQTYISQKEKERQFEEEQQRKIQLFLEHQQREKQRQPQSNGVQLMMIKQTQEPIIKPNKRMIKIKVKKPDPQTQVKEQDDDDFNTKVRVLN